MRAYVASGDVRREPGGEAALYEDIDKIVRSVERNNKLTEYPAAYEFPDCQPAAPIYETAGEATKSS